MSALQERRYTTGFLYVVDSIIGQWDDSEGPWMATRGVPALKGCERELVADAIGALDWMSGLSL